MKSRHTHYKGYHFRSRLEARWAVFFDALDVAWDYEFQDYLLDDDVRYLPDFWLPNGFLNLGGGGEHFEIKPTEPNDAETSKAVQLARATGVPVSLAFGMPDKAIAVFEPDGTHWVHREPCLSAAWARALDDARAARFEFGADGVGQYGAVFFHSTYPDGRLEWQGEIVKRLPGGSAKVQLYSWVTGCATDEIVVPEACMVGWKFYTSRNEWLTAADTFNRGRWGR